jgi:hypothetical protein
MAFLDSKLWPIFGSVTAIYKTATKDRKLRTKEAVSYTTFRLLGFFHLYILSRVFSFIYLK